MTLVLAAARAEFRKMGQPVNEGFFRYEKVSENGNGNE